MGEFYTKGVEKVRPGNYQRYEDNSPREDGAVVAVGAAIFKSNWGPQGVVMDVDPLTDLDQLYGSEGTVDMLREMLKGSVSSIKAVRMGSGGTHGRYTFQGTSDEDSVLLELRHCGSRRFTVSCRVPLSDETKKEIVLYEGGNVVNKVQFVAGESEVDNLMIAVGDGNPFYTVKKLETSSGTLKEVGQSEVEPGTNGTTELEDYSDAFSLLESHIWDVLAVDSENPKVHQMVVGFIDRIYKNGAMVQAVIGEPITVSFLERLRHASEFNNNRIVYVGGSAYMGSKLLDGYRAAARVAGMIAGYDCSQSLTHKPITGASDLAEPLTNQQYNDAIKNGMLLFSKSRKGTVRIDDAINTLVTPGLTEEGTQDAGWKKIKRTRIRHELMNRISERLDSMIGNVNADGDGKAEIKSAIEDVTYAMEAENKIANANVSIEPKMSPDSAWFNIECDDIDSLEKIYVLYRYRYRMDEE